VCLEAVSSSLILFSSIASRGVTETFSLETSTESLEKKKAKEKRFCGKSRPSPACHNPEVQVNKKRNLGYENTG